MPKLSEKVRSPMIQDRYKALLQAMEEMNFSTVDVMTCFIGWYIDVARHYGVISYAPTILKAVATKLEKELCDSMPKSPSIVLPE